MPDRFEFVVEEADAGMRLDRFLAARLPQESRAALQRAIEAAVVHVDGMPTKPACRLRVNARVTGAPLTRPPDGPLAEDIPLSLLYEDDQISVINKPAGMVVHPAKGHWSGTLAAALAFRYDQLSGIGGPTRPGIVHRLDRDTSGVLVVARTDAAHAHLARQFAARTVEKQYDAIVVGVPDRDQDVIRHPLGHHPRQREKMAVLQGHPTSREAETFYHVVSRFDGFALLQVVPKTGRTHQIRVHLCSLRHPVLCDRLYGSRARITRNEIERSTATPHPDQPGEALLERQALHARRICFDHPTSGDRVSIEAPMPQDMQSVLAALRRWRAT
jgi:23S rRNA pseudouridine1911/1915/1917 synthase